MTDRPGADREPEAPGGRPGILDDFSEIGAAGRSAAAAAKRTGEALRALVAADIALARSALGRMLALMAVAIVFGVSAWLLLMAGVVAVLVGVLHWSWMLSLFVVAVANIVVTAWAALRSISYFEHTRLKATRRQLARFGIGEGEAANATPGEPPQ